MATRFDKGYIKDTVAESKLMQAKLNQRDIFEGSENKSYVCAQCLKSRVYRLKKENTTIISTRLTYNDYSKAKTMDDPTFEVHTASGEFLTAMLEEMSNHKGVVTVFLSAGELIRHMLQSHAKPLIDTLQVSLMSEDVVGPDRWCMREVLNNIVSLHLQYNVSMRQIEEQLNFLGYRKAAKRQVEIINANNAKECSRIPWCGKGVPEPISKSLTSTQLVDKRFDRWIKPFPTLRKIVLRELPKGPSSGDDNLLRNYRTLIGATTAISEGRYQAGDYITPPMNVLVPETGRAFLRLGLFHPDVELTTSGDLLPRRDTHQLIERPAMSEKTNRPRMTPFGRIRPRGIENRGIAMLPTLSQNHTRRSIAPMEYPSVQPVPMMLHNRMVQQQSRRSNMCPYDFSPPAVETGHSNMVGRQNSSAGISPGDGHLSWIGTWKKDIAERKARQQRCRQSG